MCERCCSAVDICSSIKTPCSVRFCKRPIIAHFLWFGMQKELLIYVSVGLYYLRSEAKLNGGSITTLGER
jgi:hypothetical protein